MAGDVKGGNRYRMTVAVRSLKHALLEVGPVRRSWATYRARQLERRYDTWASLYEREAAARDLRYSPERVSHDVRAQLARTPTPKRPGEFHSAIATLTSNWGLGLVQELALLGQVSVFDWEQHGFSESDPTLPARLPELNRQMFQFLSEANHRNPIDWVLITGSGNVVLAETLRRIRAELGLPTVNQWLDCKQTFAGGCGPWGQDIGQRDIAREFDVVWTSSRAVCEWYLAEGARPFFLPEGFSPALTPRVTGPQPFDVGFLGARYGLRPDYIAALERAGLKVAVRGHGWKNGGSLHLADMGRFFSQSKVNLGISGVGYSMNLTTLKGRDFEVPGSGGAYLTTYNPDLASFFSVGEEIACYRTMREMVELALELVRDDGLRTDMARRAYNRSMREHRWLHRFETMLSLLGLLDRQAGNATAAGGIGS